MTLATAAMEAGALDVVFKMRAAGIGHDDSFALFFRELLIRDAEYIHFNPSRDERNFGLLMLRNAWRGVEGDCVPHELERRFWNSVAAHEVTGRICAVHLKPIF